MKESKEKTMEREEPEARKRYPHFLRIPTRWMDNDVYGHVNTTGTSTTSSTTRTSTRS